MKAYERFYVNAMKYLLLCAVITSFFGEHVLSFGVLAPICLIFGCSVAYYFHQWHEKEDKKTLQNEKHGVE